MRGHLQGRVADPARALGAQPNRARGPAGREREWEAPGQARAAPGLGRPGREKGPVVDPGASRGPRDRCGRFSVDC